MLFIVKDLLKNKSRMDNNTFKVFVDACMIEVNKKGNTPTSHFNKVGWENLRKHMKEKTGKNYERKQLKKMGHYEKIMEAL